MPALLPLRLQAFRHLALARFVDELGDWLGEVALAVLVFDRTGSPLATAALFLGLQFLPGVLAPALVANLETLSARRTLALLNLAQAAAFAALAGLTGRFSLVAVVGLAAIAGSLAVSSRALTRAAAAAVAPPDLLREGNAILNLGFTIGAAVGPALAGVVVATAGAEVALYADAASFACVAILLATASRLPAARPAAGEGWVVRVRKGILYVRDHAALARLLAAQAMAMAFFALVIPIEVAFAKASLGAGDAGYGLLLASWGAGMVAGAALFAALRRVPLRTMLFVSTLAIGGAYLATSAAPTLAVACAASAVGGAGNGAQWVGVMTAAQELADAEHQARVISLLEAAASAMPGIGFLAGGAIAAALSPRAGYAVAGIAVLAVLALGSRMLRDALGEPGVPEPASVVAARLPASLGTAAAEEPSRLSAGY